MEVGIFLLKLFGAMHLSSRELLQLALRRTHGNLTLPGIAYTSHGKPYFPNLPEIHFNLSHSGVYTLCALSSHCVGVDIEIIKTRKTQLPQYALTEKEYTEYLSLGGDLASFYHIWTKKEAYVKFNGQSIVSFKNTEIDNTLQYSHYTQANFKACLCSTLPGPVSIVWLTESPSAL